LPTTQLRVSATLRAALNAAVRQREITWNPAIGVDLDSPEARERQRWTPAQAAEFIAATAGDPMGLMFLMAVLRGCRRGELCGFRWANAEMDKPYRDPATGEERTGAGAHRGAAHRPARREVARAEGKDAGRERRVFLDLDTAGLLRELAAQAGVPVVALHEGGRHTGNSLTQDAGVDQELPMREVGHADRSTNDRYTHPLEQAHLAASEQTAALVRKAGKAS
jgi:integrase